MMIIVSGRSGNPKVHKMSSKLPGINCRSLSYTEGNILLHRIVLISGFDDSDGDLGCTCGTDLSKWRIVTGTNIRNNDVQYYN